MVKMFVSPLQLRESLSTSNAKSAPMRPSVWLRHGKERPPKTLNFPALTLVRAADQSIHKLGGSHASGFMAHARSSSGSAIQEQGKRA